jgi:hypothetical protein
MAPEINGPDAYFWYTLCGVLGSLLFGLLVWIGVTTKNLLAKLVDTVADHEARIQVMEATNGKRNGGKH